MLNKKNIHIFHGSLYSQAMLLSSILGILMASALIYSAEHFLYIVFGCVIGLFSLAVMTSFSGFQYKKESNEFRIYSSTFFLKKGKWFPLNKFPDIAVVNSFDGIQVYGRANSSITVEDNGYDVVLLTKNHRTKMKVDSFSDITKAELFANNFANEFGLNFTTFSPVISQKTKSRRKSRR